MGLFQLGSSFLLRFFSGLGHPPDKFLLCLGQLLPRLLLRARQPGLRFSLGDGRLFLGLSDMLFQSAVRLLPRLVHL